MRPKQLPPDAYFAGLIDGEGWIGISTVWRTERASYKQTAVVQVGMTNWPVVEALQQRWPGHLFEKKRAREHWKDQLVWRVTGIHTRQVLYAIRPYCLVKHDDIEAVLMFLRERHGM